ncbi:SLAC1 anion channel family protein [Thiomicrorhabdus sp. ZW0627]|uniref:SLAC1 anion channel family protein n=1 Tax=Thiomicrorhabdus sp. ZW0627 TaxID=3039774 RepID=UPI0024367126|nr:SLAC1 anion channel family protein [Thiomicrorhabdus sp. ZW0627]MDG6772938.1 SLAC1 anion channel family protein [Thiomicrorhabdus sp. ZW0627]
MSYTVQSIITLNTTYNSSSIKFITVQSAIALSMFQKLISQSAGIPISLFSVAVGYLGLALGYETLLQAIGFVWPLADVIFWIGSSVFWIGFFLFAGIAIVYFLKLLFHFKLCANELKNASEGNFFSSISISVILLGLMLYSLSPALSMMLTVIGSILQFLIAIYIVSSWIYQEHWQVSDLNPAWFLPIVGLLLIPLGLPKTFPVELGWFFLSIGLTFWLIMFSLILYRLFFHPPLASYLEPTLFILIAPPALGFIAYMTLTNQAGVFEVDLVARILFYTSLFLSFLLLSQSFRFSKIPFSLASWSGVFPLTVMAIASLIMYQSLRLPLYSYLGVALLAALSLTVLYFTVRTFIALKNGHLLILSREPEIE